MNFEEYQKLARLTAIYPPNYPVIYPALGLAGESGEVLEKIKKQVRDANADFTSEHFRGAITKELGDVLWYIANIAADLDIDLEQIAKENIEKLAKRKSDNKLHGSGDNR